MLPDTEDAVDFDAYPRRLREWIEDEQGRCIVLKPRFGSGRWARLLARHAHTPCYRIRLDEIGSLIWKASDGHTPLSAIADALRRSLGVRVEPVDARLERFVRQMLRARLLELRLPASQTSADP